MITQQPRIGVALLLATMAAGGCAVGMAHVSAPPRLPAKALPPLYRTISFDVCPAPGELRARPQTVEAHRAALGDTVRRSLSRAGVAAKLAASPGLPVDLTITLRETSAPMWSVVLSMLTYSVVPGYGVERKTLDVDLAWDHGARTEKIEHLQYQARTNLFIWLPLIVAPDVIFAVTDGRVAPKVDDGGLTPMIERLGDDIRVRVGNEVADVEATGRPSVHCPTRPAAATTSLR